MGDAASVVAELAEQYFPLTTHIMCFLQVAVPSGTGDNSTTARSGSSHDGTPAVDQHSTARLQLHLAASLLQLRGDSPSTSPLVDSDGNVLCFNGEIFAGLDIAQGDNDGKALLRALQQASCRHAAVHSTVQPDASIPAAAADCGGDSERAVHDPAAPARLHHNSNTNSSRSSNTNSTGAGAIMGVLSKLRGPWSLLYWQRQQHTLWFGRDVMGECYAGKKDLGRVVGRYNT